MISKIDKNTVRQRRHARVRKTVAGTASVPRLNVYRSLNHIYAQIIDDRAGNEKGGVTLAAASTMDKDVKAQLDGLTKTDPANVVGKVLAERALQKGVDAVVFDRGAVPRRGKAAKTLVSRRAAW